MGTVPERPGHSHFWLHFRRIDVTGPSKSAHHAERARHELPLDASEQGEPTRMTL